MEGEQWPPVTFIAWNIKITKGRSMINKKHVLIMCSSYPLMTPTSLHALVASCLMGNLKKHCGVSRRLCRKSTNGNEVATNPPTHTFMSNLLWPMGFKANVRIKWVRRLNGWERGKWVHRVWPNKRGCIAVRSNVGPKRKSLVSY